MGNQTSESANVKKAEITPLRAALASCFKDIAQGRKTASVEAFQALLGGPIPWLGERLMIGLFDRSEVDEATFVDALNAVLSCDSRTSENTLSYLKSFSADRENLDAPGVQRAVHLCCCLAMALSDLDTRDDDDAGSEQAQCSMSEDRCVTACAKAIMTVGNTSDANVCSVTAANQFLLQHIPGLFDGLHCWLERAVWAAADAHQGLAPFSLPQLVSSSRTPTSSSVLCPSAVWLLSTSLPPCFLGHYQAKGNAAASQLWSAGGSWTLLYSSDNHGLSMNRFKHHVMDYRGPTLMALKCSADRVLVLAVDTEWRETSSSWGGADCSLVQLLPTFSTLTAGSQQILLNERTRGLPTGLGIGRDLTSPVCHIDTSLQEATINQAWPAADKQTVAILSIEVWGCGGADLQEAQQRQKAWDKRQVERRKKVKRPGRWDENADALLLEWGGVHTRSQFQREREEDNAYKT